MSQSSDSLTGENRYPIDPENAGEMVRLLDQDRLVTKGLGGLLPERNNDFTGLGSVLDIACGPGGWVQEVAFANPDIEITGIDISRAMIAYAKQQAQIQHLNNAHFQVMNVTVPLAFADATFDLVNARFIVGFMPPKAWPSLLQECRRILRPGGTLRLTEGEWGGANTPAFEKLAWLGNQALARAGQSFSPNGLHLGIVPMLARLVREAGFEHIEQQAKVLDVSAGTEANYGFFKDMQAGFTLSQPFFLKWQVASKEEIELLTQTALAEMLSSEFCALTFSLTVWGHKP